MKKALENINESFMKQLKEVQDNIMDLEQKLLQQRELGLKLQGALEGFALVDKESKKPENLPMVQLDDEDEDSSVTVEDVIEE